MRLTSSLGSLKSRGRVQLWREGDLATGEQSEGRDTAGREDEGDLEPKKGGDLQKATKDKEMDSVPEPAEGNGDLPAP